jgi:hypothetical protein
MSLFPYESLKKEVAKVKRKLGEIEELDLSDPVTFIEKYVRNPKDPTKPFSFEKRDYLLPLYRDMSKKIVIVKSRQMEITEFAVNMLIYWSLKHPGVYVYAQPTLPKVARFSKDRLRKQIQRSPTLKKFLGETDVKRIEFGESVIYLYSTFGEMDTLRGIPADAVILDEVQDMDISALAVAEEMLSHSDFKRMWLIGTPKEAGSKFEELWNMSDKKEWDAEKKMWIPTNTDRETFYSGYHITQKMAIGLWMTEEEIERKRKTYTKQRFVNEVLGEFYSGIGRPVSFEDVWRCFTPLIKKGVLEKGRQYYAGIDWGVGRKAYTVFVLMTPMLKEYPDIYYYDVVYVKRIDYPEISQHVEECKNLIKKFNPLAIGCDIGMGYVQNQELYKTFGSIIVNVQYLNRPDKTFEVEPSIFGTFAKVDRTTWIDLFYDKITKGLLRIYEDEDDDIKEWIVNNILAEYPEVEELPSGRRIKKWVHDSEQTDDLLHALIYSMVAFETRKEIVGHVDEYVGFVS